MPQMIRSRCVRVIMLGVVGLALAGASAALPPSEAGAAAAPGELLAFYGWPTYINGAAGNVAAAAAELGRYDVVLLGGTTKVRDPQTSQWVLVPGVEDPSHPDHAGTVALLADPAMAGTLVFGYVNLGVTNGGLTMTQVKARIDQWRAAGADGIHLDAFGYDWEVTRQRQNEAVAYVHSLDMPVLANSWFPADAFGSIVDEDHNPTGTPTLLGAGDYYMSESFRVRLGVLQDGEVWRAKADELAFYQAELGFGVMSVTTNNPSDVYSEQKFFAAWYAAAEYGHVATGWGEYWFSADDGLAPYRTRPNPVEPPPPAAAFCAGLQATITGTAGNDTLNGTAEADVIAGLGGNDIIHGGGGRDVICGGAGADTIDGGTGADLLRGGLGSDELLGDEGEDVLKGNGGGDRLDGGDGDDRMVGGSGPDVMLGGAGDDRLGGKLGDDFLHGGDGFDRARGGVGADVCDAERTFTCEG
jgi:hypothetical protein